MKDDAVTSQMWTAGLCHLVMTVTEPYPEGSLAAELSNATHTEKMEGLKEAEVLLSLESRNEDMDLELLV